MGRGNGIARVCCLAALALGCGDDAEVGICDADELVAALEAAEPGDVVQLGRCTVTGTFALQAGVELRGFGPDDSRLELAGRVGMSVSAGTAARPSALRNLRMTSLRTARAVLATGDGTGEVRVENVEVSVQAGSALVASSLERLVVTQSRLEGALPDDPASALDSVFANVTSALPDPLPAASECTTEPVNGGCMPGVPLGDVSCADGSCGPFERFCDACGREVVVASDTGLLAANVDVVEVDGLEISGFVNFGIAHSNTELGTTRVTTALLAGNTGTGVFVSGTSLTLEDVEVTRQYERIVQSVAAVFVQNEDFPAATVRTDGLRLIDVSAYGVIQRGGSAEHVAPMTMNQQFPSFWAGEVDAFMVSDGMLTDGRLAGIVTVEARNVEVMDTTLQRTRASRTTIGQQGSLGAIGMGDGIHAVATPDLFLEGVRFTNNERVGLLLDLGPMGAGDMPCIDGRGICIDGSNTVESADGVPGALGARVGERESAVISRPVTGEGAWGAALERLGGAANDGDLPADLAEQIVGAVAPIDRPRPDGAVAPID